MSGSNAPDCGSIEFRPRASNGRLWAGGIGLGTLLMFAVPMLLAADEMPVAIGIMLLVVGVFSAGPPIVVAWYVPSMRYRLTRNALHLHFGPLMNDRIPLDSIRSVSKHERLKNSPLASFRFPGLAVFDVDYLGMRRTRMCATAASTDILIIETDRKLYGITPGDEASFVEALLDRVDNPNVVDVQLVEQSGAIRQTAGVEGRDGSTD